MTNYERVDQLQAMQEQAYLPYLVGDRETFDGASAELDREVKPGFVDCTLFEQGPGQLINDAIFKELAEIGELINKGEYQPLDAYRNMIDVYWGWQKSLDDQGKQVMEELIFGYAKGSEIEMEDALYIWKEQEEMEQAK